MHDDKTIAEQAPESSEKKSRIRYLRLIRYTMFCLALVLFAVGLSGLSDRQRVTTAPAEPPKPDVVVTDDVSEPAEVKPSEQYDVAADQPRRIILPSISVEGFVQKVGLNKENAISVPDNIHFAGWFTDSVKPGDPGLSIIDGHVSGRYNDGIFKNLSKLESGGIFEVEYGDLSKRAFKVVEIKTLPEAESAQYLLEKREDIDGQLNLITCGGDFNREAQTYNDRVIVVAQAI